MATNADPLREIFPLLSALEDKGLQPVLVGGMALVILGSQRITKDFDFLVSSTAQSQDVLGEIYRQAFQLVTKISKAGEVERSIDNVKVAAARLRLEKPRRVFFFNWEIRLRVDLLLDFPLPTGKIASRAAQVGKRPRTLRVAAPEDLLELKEIAYADRKSSSDAQDLEFLRKLLKARS